MIQAVLSLINTNHQTLIASVIMHTYYNWFPTGAVIFEDKIYIGISGSGLSDILDEQDQVVGLKKNNLIVIDTVETSDDEVEGKIIQEAWREIF